MSETCSYCGGTYAYPGGCCCKTRFDDIQEEIARWSRINSGNFVSKNTGFPLGSTAPAMAIAEAVGAFYMADNRADESDALGGILIHAMDFAGRDGFRLRGVGEDLDLIIRQPFPAYVGLLCHATLNRHQGTRGFDASGLYDKARDTAMRGILAHVGNAAALRGQTILTTLEAGIAKHATGPHSTKRNGS